MITFDGVSVEVETPGREGPGIRTVLRVDGLAIDEQHVCVIGPNGGGKSTFLQLINGLVLPSGGRVLVDGRDTARAGAEVRRSTGFVFTDPAAQLVMPTPIEDVELSLRASVKDRKERRRLAEAVLASLDIAHLADRSVYELSGGERQLVALSCVLALKPTLLLLDEPTTLLDLANRARFERTLAALRGAGLRTVTCTHDLEAAERADRVLLVAGGEVAADGPATDVVERYRASVAEDHG